ncbi:hypothetical protein E5Q_05212 [Mixia osmundae IAM 14324]|uniref:Uncharacterized protein n=1 Tax=Mixia osmundae (strain CBS 9802 / IAM 14324 / JCM 22182 / KY 12970) TaxID=764103 RepID=G7E6R5_MIXOS|nr:hypothetical protein E5Q_05212 [Mixia osmundae IAM 14324]
MLLRDSRSPEAKRMSAGRLQAARRDGMHRLLGCAARMVSKYASTPDGRYFVDHTGRLWRCTNPSLDETERQRWVKKLMDARREVRTTKGTSGERSTRAKVQEAKEALGERGAVWWRQESEDDRDWNRFMVKNTPYAAWHTGLTNDESGSTPSSSKSRSEQTERGKRDRPHEGPQDDDDEDVEDGHEQPRRSARLSKQQS